VACSASLVVAPTADADPRFGPNDVRTLFEIGKSDDRNVVQYGIRLDKECMPVGDEPIYVYWRQFEKGPDVTEDLNLLDKTVYGIKGEWVTKRAADGSKVLMTLRSTDRPIAIVVKRSDNGKCVGDAIASINGQPAHLERVFVHIAGFLKVDWIEIRGRSVANGSAVVERVNR
jgi:hypothetical protein